MDEYFSMVKGWVANRRFIRANTEVIHCSLVPREHRTPMSEALPLPFDDEANTTSESDKDFYDEAIKEING